MESFDIIGFLSQQGPTIAILVYIYIQQRKDHREAILEKDKRITDLNNENREDQKATLGLLIEIKGLMAVIKEKL